MSSNLCILLPTKFISIAKLKLFSSTDLPSPSRTASYTVQQYGRDSVTLTVQWQPPQYDGGAPVNYTITVTPGLSPVTTSGTSVPVTLPYNVIHTVSIVATNCRGNSSATIVTIPAIGQLCEVICLDIVFVGHTSHRYVAVAVICQTISFDSDFAGCVI